MQIQVILLYDSKEIEFARLWNFTTPSLLTTWLSYELQVFQAS